MSELRWKQSTGLWMFVSYISIHQNVLNARFMELLMNSIIYNHLDKALFHYLSSNFFNLKTVYFATGLTIYLLSMGVVISINLISFLHFTLLCVKYYSQDRETINLPCALYRYIILYSWRD
jgi:hypothetical protein